MPALERAVLHDEQRRHVDKVRPELHLACALRDRPAVQLLRRCGPEGDAKTCVCVKVSEAGVGKRNGMKKKPTRSPTAPSPKNKMGLLYSICGTVEHAYVASVSQERIDLPTLHIAADSIRSSQYEIVEMHRNSIIAQRSRAIYL
jgi:hypothetical protein